MELCRKGLKNVLKRTWIFEVCRWLAWPMYQRIKYRSYLRNGRTGKPPHVVKSRVVAQYAQLLGIRVFIETGTYRGDMIRAVKDLFEEVYTIELDEALYRSAKKRFATAKNVFLLCGDSGELLGEVLKRMRRPCVMWLDAHFSRGISAHGPDETPVLRELHEIMAHTGDLNHVILVDDAEAFSGVGGYPTIRDVEERAKRGGYTCCEIRDDIIRLHRDR